MSFPSIFSYNPRAAEVLWKTAAEEESKHPFLSIFAGGAAGAAAGWGAGKGLGYLLDDYSIARTGRPIKARNLIIPGTILGAVAAAAYADHQKKEVEELRRAAANYRNRRSGRTSGE